MRESCIKELPISTAARIQYLIISLSWNRVRNLEQAGIDASGLVINA